MDKDFVTNSIKMIVYCFCNNKQVKAFIILSQIIKNKRHAIMFLTTWTCERSFPETSAWLLIVSVGEEGRNFCK